MRPNHRAIAAAVGTALLLHFGLMLPADSPQHRGRAGSLVTRSLVGRVQALQTPQPVDDLSLPAVRNPATVMPELAKLQIEGPPAPRIPSGWDAKSSGKEDAVDTNVSEYVDSKRLTIRPTPVRDIFIPTPESSERVGSFKATLVLFIDEDGTVTRIDIEDSDLPADFEAAARSTFGAAQFHPGMIEHHVVKSKMRVEVGFDVNGSRT